MKPNKNKTVAVMGNSMCELLQRDNSGVILNQILDETIVMVEYLYNEGYRNFLLSMNDGFGNIAADAISMARKIHPDIYFIAVVSHVGEELSYHKHEMKRYSTSLNDADRSIILSYSDENIDQMKEKLFLKHCSHLLCYFFNEEDCLLIQKLNSTNIYDLL